MSVSSPAFSWLSALRIFVLALVAATGLPALPAQDDSAVPKAEQLAAALARLKEAGVITDVTYWEDNAQPGKKCDGGDVGDLIMASARKWSEVDSLDKAVDILVDNKVIQNKTATYWKQTAVSGSSCTGGFVARMILRLAETLP